MLQNLLSMSFTLTFVAFIATAFYLFLERDRVPEHFRVTMRVSTVYLTIAAINYYYMRTVHADGIAAGVTRFPTEFRYIDWLLTTPLMLLKFPLVLGVGEKGKSFMTKLVLLDLAMIGLGYAGELSKTPLFHHGLFMLGCFGWLAILALLFGALSSLPDRITPAVRQGVRTMGSFVLLGWAIYPAGYAMPLLGVPNDFRELTYNIADLVNKVGLCLVIYFTAKANARELAEEGMDPGYDPSLAHAEPLPVVRAVRTA
jgi:sensory rhodopsin